MIVSPEQFNLGKIFEYYEYDVRHTNEVTFFKNENVTGAFSFEYYIEDFYHTATRSLIADNKNSLNKWSQCPLVMPITDAMADFKQTLRYLDWLGTADGEDYSSYMHYMDPDKRQLPYQLPTDPAERCALCGTEEREISYGTLHLTADGTYCRACLCSSCNRPLLRDMPFGFVCSECFQEDDFQEDDFQEDEEDENDDESDEHIFPD